MSLPGRRRFLFGAGALGFGALGLRSRVDPVVPPALARPTSAGIELPETLRVLSVPEYFTLSAACERIFPRDDAPGAIDLGAPVYIDRALAVRPLPVWADDFRGGLARLDADAMGRFGVSFAKARRSDQEAVLTDWEATAEPQNAAFFHNLVVATLEGALSDPIHGGNTAGAGWAELGFRADPFTPTRMS